LLKNSKQRKYFSSLGDIKIEPPAKVMDKPVSISEAASYLNVSQSTVWNYIKKGKLDKVVIDKKTYVFQESIDNFARSNKQIMNENVPLSQGKAMVEVSYLEGILTLLGKLTTEKQYLLVDQDEQENRKRELVEVKARLFELETKELEARSKAAILEKENKYIRTILWILVGVGLSLVIETLSLFIKRT
jgi:DNA-binding Lrp family transcriptional regulator